MLSNGGAASDRHRQVHEEILGELRRDAAEREEFVRRSHNAPGDVDGDGFVEDHDADGDGGDRWVDEPEDGEAAAKRDEDWRGELIAHFVEAFERHFNDTAAAEDSQPRALLTTSDAAYAGLVDIGDRLGFPNDLDASTNATAAQLTWQEAEAKLAALEPLLKSARCHAFVPSDPPADDEYDYMQLHNVEHYVSEMRWHAQLNDARNGIETALKDFGKNELTSMALVEKLESLEGEKVFPSFWLFHSPGHWDDYRYGDW
ncbi:hypothetical protein M885DRAFT_239064 [Pelagophyceae sp. CCMP2097]|nr:hypothetical protein M885DRAFT_239064 [Pelagophyceae sp. CCMP2097]